MSKNSSKEHANAPLYTRRHEYEIQTLPIYAVLPIMQIILKEADKLGFDISNIRAVVQFELKGPLQGDTHGQAFAAFHTLIDEMFLAGGGILLEETPINEWTPDHE
jgi:hypothetical protein